MKKLNIAVVGGREIVMKSFEELCAKYIHRNLMEELGYSAYYTHKGYMNKENEDYYRWLTYSAYMKIKELEEIIKNSKQEAPKNGKCPNCGSNLVPITITTYPPIHGYTCFNCGWSYEDESNDPVELASFLKSKQNIDEQGSYAVDNILNSENTLVVESSRGENTCLNTSAESLSD